MPPAQPPSAPGAAPLSAPRRLLFLIADTGGGHRAAASAVTAALDEAYPGQFEVVLCDPLGGPRSARLLRWVTGLYGPSIRIAPWTWGVIYYSSDSRPAMSVLRATILRQAHRPVREAVRAQDPAAIVSFHPLVGGAARAGRRHAAPGTPLVTVVTDLITLHAAWRHCEDEVDAMFVPSAAVRWRCHLDGVGSDRCQETGLPVGPAFASGPARPSERAALRRALGLSTDRFLVVVTGGGEGSGGIDKQVASLVKAYDDIEVVAICGRNRGLRRRLDRLAARHRTGAGLVVTGFVDNMADWLRAADVVVSKAGPGTIAEATCCGAPLLLSSHVPGQERGNTEFVVNAGAGRHTPGISELVAEVGRLRRDPVAVDAMRAAAAHLSRPFAAAELARALATLVGAEDAITPLASGQLQNGTEVSRRR